MATYKSTHTGQQIDDAVNVALETIPDSGDYIATSSNKLTPVNQVNAIITTEIDNAIAASY